MERKDTPQASTRYPHRCPGLFSLQKFWGMGADRHKGGRGWREGEPRAPRSLQDHGSEWAGGHPPPQCIWGPSPGKHDTPNPTPLAWNQGLKIQDLSAHYPGKRLDLIPPILQFLEDLCNRGEDIRSRGGGSISRICPLNIQDLPPWPVILTSLHSQSIERSPIWAPPPPPPPPPPRSPYPSTHPLQQWREGRGETHPMDFF